VYETPAAISWRRSLTVRVNAAAVLRDPTTAVLHTRARRIPFLPIVAMPHALLVELAPPLLFQETSGYRTGQDPGR